MKWFGRKSAGRASARPALLAFPLGVNGRSIAALGEWPQSYEAQVRDGYLGNAIAQRAVRMVAEGVASAPLKSSDDDALALVRTTSAGQHLMETVAVHLLLHGNAYIEMLTGPDGRPCELYALRPERMTVEADARGWPVAFVYRVGNAKTRMPADSVIHIRAVHPLDDHYGLGCLAAAAGPVAIHNAATRWNKALLDNAARPSGALVHEAGEALSADQFDRLQAQLVESYQGAINAGRPMLLEGGLKWQSLSMTPADMDFIALKAAAARDIALAFGVPPMLLGLPGDATYANYREANKALWRQAVLPLAGKILDALAQGLRRHFAGLTLGVDLDTVPALADEREQLWAQAEAASFLTLDEKREMAGYDPAKEEPQQQKIEVKFNPWHDTENGQFTKVGAGRRFEGGSFGGGGATGSWEESTKPARPRTTSNISKRRGVPGSWAPPEKPKTSPPVNQPKARTLPTSKGNAKPSRPVGSRRTPQGETKKFSAGGYHFEADSQDRTVRAYGNLRLEPTQGRSRNAQTNAGKPDREPKDHGGHFIAREFGGPKIRYNHFAQNARFNTSDYRALENEWKGHLKEDKKVYVDIRALYRGSSNRPDRIRVRYFVNGELGRRRFPNTINGEGK